MKRLIVITVCLLISACAHVAEESSLPHLPPQGLPEKELTSFRLNLSKQKFPAHEGAIVRLLKYELFPFYRIDGDAFGAKDGYLGSAILYYKLTDEYCLQIEDKRFHRSGSKKMVVEESAAILTKDEALRRLPADETEANKPLVPTATSVTPAADAPVAPAAAAAHL